jgi:signal transduction histidine kinase/CheY-like chemotaxis protein/ligand-binding sensor domain-containing protein
VDTRAHLGYTNRMAFRDVVEVGRLCVRVFRDTDGLPQNDVVAMAYDGAGYLWAGTQDGLARYNGRAWTVERLPNARRSTWITSLLATSDGELWVGTHGGGLARRDAGGAWSVVDATAGLPHDHVVAMCEAGDDVWVATPRGLARWRAGRWEAVALPDESAHPLCLETVAGELWVGTRDHGLLRYARGRWSTREGDPREMVRALLRAETGVYAALDAGVAVLGDGRWTPLDAAPRSAASALLETASASGGRTLWIGTNDGLVRVEGGRAVRYSTEHGLPNHVVMSLLPRTTRDGTLAVWVGTYGGGLARVDLGQWTAFDTTSGLPNKVVVGLMETDDDGRPVMWMSTYGGGVARFEDGAWRVLDATSGLPHNNTWGIAEERHADGSRTLWVCTQGGGLGRWHDGRWSVLDKESGLPENRLRSVLLTRGREGRTVAWISAYAGLARVEGDEVAVVNRASGVRFDHVRGILETTAPDGTPTLWACTHGAGLARLEGGRWSYEDTTTGLPNDNTTSAHEILLGDRRTLWVGTMGGGVAWCDLDERPLRWRVLSTETSPALANDTVYQVQRDARGRVYVTTNRGVTRLTPDASTPGDPFAFRAEHFTLENGLPSNECNGGASMVDGRGRIWVGTLDGAAVYDPAEEVEDRTPKPLVVERVLVGGRERSLEGGAALAHDENDVEFEVALLSYFREGETAYRTQLAGFDDEPSEWTTRFRRVYTNLPHGSYTFLAWGRDSSGNVSGPVRVPFRIRPAPWRRWWAYAAYTGAAAGLAAGAVRWRLAALSRRNEELEARIAERTAELEASERRAVESERRAVEANLAKSVFLSNMSHELRTPLNAVIGFTQLMARDPSLGGAHRENIESIQRSGEHLLGLINDVLSIAKIEAGRLTLEEQTYDLRRMLETVDDIIRARAEAKGLAQVFDVDASVPRLVRGDEGKLRQVLVNLLGNAVKFTDRGRVALRAGWADGRASFEVEDTGRGIAADEMATLFEAFQQTAAGRESREGTGLGLVISRNIVRLMGGDITVRSRVGEGTTFALDVRLPVSTEEVPAEERRRVVAVEPSPERWRVLVVDDVADNRRLLVQLLATVGIRAREASNGREAVDVWADWRPDLIFMDMRMPVMDGREATREIRRREVASGQWSVVSEEESRGSQPEPSSTDHWPLTTDHCVIVALTASAFEQEQAEILAGGCDDYVPKPYRDATVFEKLAEHLGARLVYEQEPAAAGNDGSLVGLAELPAEVVRDLGEALVQGDLELAGAAVDRIAELTPDLGVTLRAMVRAYQFDEILACLPAEP